MFEKVCGDNNVFRASYEALLANRMVVRCKFNCVELVCKLF